MKAESFRDGDTTIGTDTGDLPLRYYNDNDYISKIGPIRDFWNMVDESMVDKAGQLIVACHYKPERYGFFADMVPIIACDTTILVYLLYILEEELKVAMITP